jgi:hypothetical protein
MVAFEIRRSETLSKIILEQSVGVSIIIWTASFGDSFQQHFIDIYYLKLIKKLTLSQFLCLDHQLRLRSQSKLAKTQLSEL